MAAPMVTDVVTLLGTNPPDAQVAQALSVITNIAHAYTRGVGFTDGDPNGEIASVIVTATARLLRNPSGLPVREQMGQIVVDYRGGWVGWSIGERETLNRYRVMAL